MDDILETIDDPVPFTHINDNTRTYLDELDSDWYYVLADAPVEIHPDVTSILYGFKLAYQQLRNQNQL